MEKSVHFEKNDNLKVKNAMLPFVKLQYDVNTSAENT